MVSCRIIEIAKGGKELKAVGYAFCTSYICISYSQLVYSIIRIGGIILLNIANE